VEEHEFKIERPEMKQPGMVWVASSPPMIGCVFNNEEAANSFARLLINGGVERVPVHDD